MYVAETELAAATFPHICVMKFILWSSECIRREYKIRTLEE